MTKKLLLALALTLAFSLSSIAQIKPKAKIAMEQAQATALQKEKGTIKSSELEKEQGRWIYSFDIATSDGIHEVNVDANTGKVVEDSKETAADEAKESALTTRKNPIRQIRHQTQSIVQDFGKRKLTSCVS